MPVSAADFDTIFEALLDRTAYLKARDDKRAPQAVVAVFALAATASGSLVPLPLSIAATADPDLLSASVPSATGGNTIVFAATGTYLGELNIHALSQDSATGHGFWQAKVTAGGVDVGQALSLRDGWPSTQVHGGGCTFPFVISTPGATAQVINTSGGNITPVAAYSSTFTVRRLK